MKKLALIIALALVPSVCMADHARGSRVKHGVGRVASVAKNGVVKVGRGVKRGVGKVARGVAKVGKVVVFWR